MDEKAIHAQSRIFGKSNPGLPLNLPKTVFFIRMLFIRMKNTVGAQREGPLAAGERNLNYYLYLPQNSLLAILAPSAIAASFAHTTCGSTAACPTQVP